MIIIIRNLFLNLISFLKIKWKTNSKPGHAEPQKSVDLKDSNRRGSLNRHLLSEDEAKKLDEECMQRFLKINCKIVTRTKGCYDGVLIVTPSALMFDPFEANQASANNTTNNTTVNSSTSDTSAVLNESSESTETKQRTTSTSSSNSIHDEASAIIPIESISNLIMYEDLSLRDLQDYFDYQDNKELDRQVFENNKLPQTSSLNTTNETNCSEEKPRKTSSSSNHVTFNLDKTENILVAENNASTNANTIDNSMSTLLIDETKDLQTSTADEVKSEPTNCENASTSDANSDLNSCYLCVKVNNNKDFLMCPLNRKMKNRLRSEFWFQIKDKRFVLVLFLEL